ncbi:MAG: beta-glucosidase [Candidatus Lokiarchaeota archaeon]|nr:beta-glucosidase [Candidatus Lokiarchaeota archaeon]MBD3338838.1 beta-glucosidase [Candidatus Lokiarchaeota archaeon]
MTNDINFPNDFVWGVATSSYQIEGAWKEDNKGESVWDAVTHKTKLVANNDNGDIACDHYHRYKEDVQLMKKIGLKAYRFSISWPRIFPSGKGSFNEKGIKFYDNLINELILNNIEPFVTIYHWDHPSALQNYGGWENRQIIDDYLVYAKCLFDHFGDRVKFWITFNEPFIFALYFYMQGLYGGEDFAKRGLIATHNVNVAHAKAVEAYRESKFPNGKIGITHALSPVYPISDTSLNNIAVQIIDGFVNKWFCDPIFKGTYPRLILKTIQSEFDYPTISKEDLCLLKQNPIDFLGINNYTCFRVGAEKPEELMDFEKLVKVDKMEGREYSDMDQEICPECFYDLIKRIDNDYNRPAIYITENGMTCKDDKIKDGIVQDDDRISYLRRYLRAAHNALNEGVNLKGYFVWSLMDNFEWLHGYSKKFGLIKIDYKTQERIWKKSATWYSNLIKNNGFEI